MTTPGTFQPTAMFATCAAEPCDQDAVMEGLHAPEDTDARVWVPLCPRHVAAAGRGERIEYLVELHGFIPAAPAATNPSEES